jgi:hypothetical protein
MLGLFFADLMGTFDDRSVGLVRSLERSNDRMRADFAGHWNPEKSAPSLVLNATWLATGYRVAFAPFGLGSGNTLSFNPDRSRSLAEAAVVSSRFPVILPPYRAGGEVFIDGGQNDPSGLSTALDVFNTIKIVGERLRLNVKVRFIVLTSERIYSPSRLEGSRIVQGPDILFTLVSRGRLTESPLRRAVTSVVGVEGLRDLRAQKLATKESEVFLVNLDEDHLGLYFAWRISDSTHATVSLMMGRPELCPRKGSQEEELRKGGNQFEPLIANSCVMQSVVDLLRRPALSN